MVRRSVVRDGVVEALGICGARFHSFPLTLTRTGDPPIFERQFPSRRAVLWIVGRLSAIEAQTVDKEWDIEGVDLMLTDSRIKSRMKHGYDLAEERQRGLGQSKGEPDNIGNHRKQHRRENR